MKKANLFNDLNSNRDEEIFSTILKDKNFQLKRIVSLGQSTADGQWYDQKENEWFILLKGAARLQFEDNSLLDFKAGDYINLPAGCKHRVEWTDSNQETVWLALYYNI